MPPPSEAQIRILLADDHHIVREGIRTFLQARKELTIVGEAENGSDAVRLARELKPDIVLMDVNMPVMNGIEATRAIRDTGLSIKILILTVLTNQTYITELMSAGAQGYLRKDTNPTDLVKAIKAVHTGHLSFNIPPPAEETLPVEPPPAIPNPLSPRELEVLRLVAQGKTSKEIAMLLDVALRTVNTHRERIMTKLKVHSTAELVGAAHDHGLVGRNAASNAPVSTRKKPSKTKTADKPTRRKSAP